MIVALRRHGSLPTLSAVPSHTLDVRLSATPLTVKQLLVNTEGVGKETVGFWQFEQTPGMLKDSSPNGLHLQRIGIAEAVGPADPREAALVDLCLVLMNANEFLYVD